MRYLRNSTTKKLSSSIEVEIQFDRSFETESMEYIDEDDNKSGSNNSRAIRSIKKPIIHIEESINPFNDPLWERFIDT